MSYVRQRCDERILVLSGGKIAADRKEHLPMHDFLIAAAFIMMVILPCIVTMGSGSTEEDGDEA